MRRLQSKDGRVALILDIYKLARMNDLVLSLMKNN